MAGGGGVVVLAVAAACRNFASLRYGLRITLRPTVLCRDRR